MFPSGPLAYRVSGCLTICLSISSEKAVWSSLAGSSNRIHVIQVRLGRLEVTPVPISRYDPALSRYDPARNVTDPVDADQGVRRGRPHPRVCRPDLRRRGRPEVPHTGRPW